MAFEFLEYEEKVGRLWHRLIGEQVTWPAFPEAAVELAPLKASLAVFFRGTGGEPGLELAPASPRGAGHRLRLRQRLGMLEERVTRAERTDELVLLPPRLDFLPEPGLNRILYLWLAAFLANARPPAPATDPLSEDLTRLRAAHLTTVRVLQLFPGLRAVHEQLARAVLELWPRRRLPPLERRVESVAQGLLGAPSPDPELWAAVVLGTGPPAGLRPGTFYKPSLPVPLWGEVRPGSRLGTDSEDPGDPSLQEGEEEREAPHRRGRRRELDADRRRDPLTLINKGELLLLAADMVNVNRPDDEEDPDAARRAAEDMDELAIGSRDRKSASRLKIELDLDSGEVDAAPVRAELAYPEWDHRRKAYLPNHCALVAEVLWRRASSGSRMSPPGARSAACAASSRHCGQGASSCVPSSTATSSTPTRWSAPGWTLRPAGAAATPSISRPGPAPAILPSPSWSTPRSRPTPGSRAGGCSTSRSRR